ncbi:MAG: hypothetical protein QOH32_2239 [Bradyrhizobium sp.]|jgi:hypothetical protein|nr:hypothetical protein [Bradyrhizobium sp.]
MVDQPKSNTDNNAPRSLVQRIFAGTDTQSIVQAGGLIFVGVSAIAFIYAVVTIIRSTAVRRVDPGEYFWQSLISANIDLVAPIIIAVLSALIAIRLFSKAGSLTSQVVRESDKEYLWPLITAANKDAINEYIRLASLSGFTGTFQYLGFTGLPLATVGLTLILLVIALWVDDDELRKGVFDMAKLTLGAFLGSFVQRNLETEKLTSTGGTPQAAPDRVSIGKDLDDLDGKAKTLRAAVAAKKSTVDPTKQSEYNAIDTALTDIEQKIAAAKTSVADASQPMDKVNAAADDARKAAAGLDDLTTRLGKI